MRVCARECIIERVCVAGMKEKGRERLRERWEGTGLYVGVKGEETFFSPFSYSHFFNPPLPFFFFQREKKGAKRSLHCLSSSPVNRSLSRLLRDCLPPSPQCSPPPFVGGQLCLYARALELGRVLFLLSVLPLCWPPAHRKETRLAEARERKRAGESAGGKKRGRERNADGGGDDL